MTLKSNVPFYDGLLPGEDPLYEPNEKLFRRSLKFFSWLRKAFLNMLGKLKSNAKLYGSGSSHSFNACVQVSDKNGAIGQTIQRENHWVSFP